MSCAFETYFESLKGKKIAVFGLGVSNRPLVRLLLEFGCDVLGCDRTPREKLDAEVLELEAAGCKLSVGDGYLDHLDADLVFRTPGMHPGNPALEDLRSKGAEVTSEMEVFFEVCPCTILAVTGSDGKTTTTTLISEMLKAAGKTVWVGGNIGAPLLPRVREMNPEDYAVVELSSFQLMDMKRSPHIAVVTNLAPNHLDIHKDMDEYVEAKKTIFRYQGREDILVVNADNAITASFKGNGVTRTFSRQGRDAYVRVVGDTITRGGVPVLKKGDILIPGEHNVENYMAAIAAVDGLVDDETIRQVAKTFGGVEHRIELVRVKDGVRYYNDSIASSPSRTIAGLRSFPEKVILIAGGYDKHIPYDVLGPEICAHVKLLVLGGATGPKIRAAVEDCPDYRPGCPEIVDCGDFTAAVKAAAAAARSGDVVLMSPASAAFDQFKNFMARGKYFKDMVMEL
ncbi:MAG: UDP-N-acetylmuramoyl-L-alanine--D-glutamate ligase [Clostridiales bacterium]|nr:UDP-N-acetylmuramoyl-L-alanine--D-glutamate ligase [Clostridiales bacterium]MDY6040561.1 UDP-N-acetylmuramoyl-L-alanine--D-glutamate ligase [Candidatus Faecousia sp.]